MTQSELAERMTKLGFVWTRVTVAEIEGPKRRRVPLDEWLGVAQVFGIPAMRLLETPRGTKLTIAAGLQGLSVFEVLKLLAGAEALDEWYRQIGAEHAVLGAGEAYRDAVDVFTEPVQALRKLADAFEQRITKIGRAAQYGDLLLASHGERHP